MNHRPFVMACQVAYLSGAENCTKIHYLSGLVDVRARTLVEVDAFYPSFIRIHKQFSVNPDAIVCVHITRLKIHIPNGGRCRKKMRQLYQVSLEVADAGLLPVSDRRWPELKAFLVRRFPSQFYTEFNRDQQPILMPDLFKPV